MPAVRITKVIPSAMTPVIEICLSTLRMLAGRKNTGESNAEAATSSMNTTRIP